MILKKCFLVNQIYRAVIKSGHGPFVFREGYIFLFDKDLYLTWAFTTIVVALRLRTASKVKESSVLRPRIDIILYTEIDTPWTSKPKNI